jgi:hypothetical protein
MVKIYWKYRLKLFFSGGIYELISTQLSKIPAGKQLSHLLVLTHINVKQYVKDSRLNYPSDFMITYRLLEQCINTLCYLVNKNINPVDACYWSLIRSYCLSLRDINEYRFFINQLSQAIDKLQLRSPSTIYSTATDQFDQKQSLWLQEAQCIRSHFIQFEKFLIEFQITLLQILALDNKHLKPTRDLLILFLDDIILLLKPSDAQIIQLKQILINDDDNINLDLSKMLFELAQTIQINTQFDKTQTYDVSNFIQDFINNGSKSFQSVCDQLSSLLDIFMRNTSFNDTNQRLSFLQRSTSIIEIFQRFFSSTIFANFDRKTNLISLCSHLTQYIRPLLIFKNKSKSYELFNDAKNQFRLHMFSHFDTGIIWSFERAQTFPIRLAKKDLRKLIQHIIKDQTNPNII